MAARCLLPAESPGRKKILTTRSSNPSARTHAFAVAPGDLIVSDARGTFAGPITAFADCSRKHDRFPGMLRPVLLPEGVAELKRHVRFRGGMLPPIPAEAPLAQAA